MNNNLEYLKYGDKWIDILTHDCWEVYKEHWHYIGKETDYERACGFFFVNCDDIPCSDKCLNIEGFTKETHE